jgi:hypothetical protein
MDEVKTGVDDLMDVLRQVSRISLPDAAKRLRQPEKTIQNWVDFLVEEKLVGIEYKFTTPYIYLNAPEKAASVLARTDTIENLRKLFVTHAMEKGMPQEKLKALWENHLSAIIESRNNFFVQECLKRNLAADAAQAAQLFQRYKERAIQTYELGTIN